MLKNAAHIQMGFPITVSKTKSIYSAPSINGVK